MSLCSHCKTPVPEASRLCRACGADLSNPDTSARTRAAIKSLFDQLTTAVGDRYTIVDLLGRGGMGAVFLAEDRRLGRRVAIKVLLPDLAEDAKFVGRFEREARTAAGLDHPNIVPIYAVEQSSGLQYFVMKYVPGRSLDALLPGGPLPIPVVERALAEAAVALGHAHGRGVVHRDVKPANMLIGEDGHLLLTDFGISKALQGVTQLTSTGQLLGTPTYMSPEQAAGTGVDARSDQYALGVVAYQMLVGHPPFAADSVHALLYQHRYETAPSPHEVRPEVPPALSAAVQRAMSKSPDDRFASMADFAAAIIGEGLSTAPARNNQRQVPVRWLVAGVIAAGLLVVLLYPRSGSQVALRPTPAAKLDSSRSPVPTHLPEPETAAAPYPRDTASGQPTATALDTAPRLPPARERPPPEPGRRKRDRTAGPMVAAGRESVVAAPTDGYLTVNAIPYGSVSVDGIDIGDTPIVRRALTPGRHVVRLSRDGYRIQTDTITISAGNEIRFSRSLIEENR